MYVVKDMDLAEKLIGVKRTIGVYNKTDKGDLGEVLNELNIDYLSKFKKDLFADSL
jgi:hypothetical protein